MENNLEENVQEWRDKAFDLMNDLELFPIEKTLDSQDYRLVSAKALSETIRVVKLLIDGMSYIIYHKEKFISEVRQLAKEKIQ